jgi:Na+-translocating ferredoxin:NAD+ oxidoreductase RnfA subunit
MAFAKMDNVCALLDFQRVLVQVVPVVVQIASITVLVEEFARYILRPKIITACALLGFVVKRVQRCAHNVQITVLGMAFALGPTVSVT